MDILDKNNVYKKDKLLYEYTTVTDFSNRLNLNELLNTLNSVEIYPENQQDVIARTLSSYLLSTTKLSYTNNFILNNASVNELFLEIKKGTSLYNFNDFRNVLIANVFLIDTNSDFTHSQMDVFMKSILYSCCETQFKSIFDKLSINSKVKNIPEELSNALAILSNMFKVSKNTSAIINLVTDKISDILSEELSKTSDLNVNMMTDFSGLQTSFKSPMYYVLRSRLAEELIIPRNIINGIDSTSDVMVFIKKIIGDSYIKTYYPMLHYIFLDNLLEKYQRKGDYINTRLALLAKIFLTVNILSYVQTLYENSSTVLNLANLTIFGTYNKILSDYLTKLNNNNLNASPGGDAIASILNEVHTKSSDVVNANNNVNILRENALINQRGLRNIIANNESAKKKLRRYLIMFYCVLGLLFITLGLSILFIIIGKLEYSYYISISLIFFIILLKIIEVIRSFIVQM